MTERYNKNVTDSQQYDEMCKNIAEAEQCVEMALSLALCGKHEQALNTINRALELDPQFAEAYNKKGDCLYKLGRIEEALEAYKKSQEIDPDLQNNYFDLGKTYLLLKDYENSLENFKKANSMKPQSEIHAYIGVIYFEQNKYDEALESFDHMLKENSSHTMSAYYTGMILMTKGETQKAEEIFDRIIDKYSKMCNLKQRFAEGHYYIGKAQFFKGEYEKAEKNIELAIEFDTDAIYNHYSFDMFYTDAEAFATLAEIQNKLGKRDSAKENILKAVSLEPNNKKLLDLKTKLGY